MSGGRRGGERRRACAQAHAPDASTRDRRLRSADASFARSFDPCTSILTTHGAPKASSWWGDRSGITVGKAHASGRNQHWGWTGGRRAARRVSPLPQGRGRGTSRKGRRSRPPSLRGSRAPVGFARTSWFQLQKSEGDIWPRISSANALQKGRSGSSERGPSSEWRSAGDTVGRRIERRECRGSASPLKTGEDRHRAQGGARASFSGCDIAKSGGVFAGPGL